MEIVLIFIIIVLVLFVPAFVAKRRFGLLGLALAAGSLLSSIWGYDVGLVVSGLGIPTSLFTTAVILSLIILLPAGILLFHGSTYKTLIGRVIGASLFTLLAFAFLIEPLGRVLMPTGFGLDVYHWLINNHTFIIGAGLIIAVFDLFFTKPAHLTDKRRKH
jgi:hypothetical protein